MQIWKSFWPLINEKALTLLRTTGSLISGSMELANMEAMGLELRYASTFTSNLCRILDNLFYSDSWRGWVTGIPCESALFIQGVPFYTPIELDADRFVGGLAVRPLRKRYVGLSGGMYAPWQTDVTSVVCGVNECNEQFRFFRISRLWTYMHVDASTNK